MKTFIPSPLLTLAVLALSLGGCGNVAPGQSVLVVNAEKSLEVSFEAVNAFVQAEDENQVAIKRDLPAVHLYAESIRKSAPKAFAEARDAIRAYKASRTTADGDAMNAKLAQVQSLARLAREYLIRVQTR